MSPYEPSPEGLNTDPAPPSVVETLKMPDNKTVTFDASQWQIVPKVPTDEMIENVASFGKADGSNGYNLQRGKDFANSWADALAAAAAPTPAAQSAGQEAVAANFACYLIDHCEGETVTEELVQLWLTRMLADPQYAAPVNGGERESDCSGEPECCPQNEGYGCHCGTRNSDVERVNGGERPTLLRERAQLEQEWCVLKDLQAQCRAALTSPAKVGGDGRKAFEAHPIIAKKYNLRRDAEFKNKYENFGARCAWEGWQARAALSATEQSK